MLYLEDIKISFKCQGYEAIQYGMSPSNDQAVLMLRSTRGSRDETCPRCGEKVYIYDINIIACTPKIPIAVFVLEICMSVENHQTAFAF